MPKIRLPLVLSLAFVASSLAATKTPRYKAFPAEVFTGRPAAAKPVSKEARQFRTVIREGAQIGTNFAGHYTIVSWGCGTSCIQFSIVDAKTGAVFMPDFYIAFSSNLEQEKLRDEEPLQFRPDSKLLVVVGSRNEKGEGVYFYKWDANKLTLIHSAMQKIEAAFTRPTALAMRRMPGLAFIMALRRDRRAVPAGRLTIAPAC
jgi:hypothetical protein